MSEATLTWAAGPVIHARMHGPFQIYEALAVGERGLLGEVVQLKGDELIAQVYEDTAGLEPGAPLRGTEAPLSVLLGPGLLGQIYDGLLRPLTGLDAPFLAAGERLRVAQRFAFEPDIKVGERLVAGQVWARAPQAGRLSLVRAPPGVDGVVASIATAGDYEDHQSLCAVVDAQGRERSLSLLERWPVRMARPVAARLPASTPMITGQRILDTLFPIARGGRAALPGGFGTGKTVLQQALAKWCDADVIVYVGCGERGNEMAEVLNELPVIEDPRTGRPLLERTVIIANTSNMPVAAREASIYTAITVAEYLRDQGLHVALMADSTSRWAEALREISGRLGELPGEAGYPAYLSSRLASFYERAARVRTLGGDEGSVTVIGAISPPGGDFSEPVTMHTRRFVRSFWALDPERARARFYPAVNPLTSYSEDAGRVTAWWQANGNSNWLEHRRRLLDLLGQQARLERMARIVGKDALPAPQQLTLLLADLANEALLQQSSFSVADRYCSPARQSAMLRLVMRFVELAEAALARGVPIRTLVALPILPRLKRLGEEHGETDLAGIEELGREVEAIVLALAANHAP
ncbi:MAG: V-type ATP synthase subunit A [Pseudomonadota bacterium]